MTNDHDAYWAAVASRHLTPEAIEHERRCQHCRDLRWGLDDLVFFADL